MRNLSTRFAIVSALLLLVASSAQAARVTLEWNANTETDLAGYRLFYATRSLMSLTTAQAVADPSVTKLSVPSTSTVVSNLAYQTSYYFRLTAYNTSGMESDFNTDLNNQGTEVSTRPAFSIAIVSPAAGSTFTAPANIAIAANASIVGGNVTRVEFLRNGVFISSSAVAPYAASWTNASSGTYALTARAYDDQGSSVTSSAVNVTVNVSTLDLVAPTVSISTPAAGATVTGAFFVAAVASDNIGISRVEFYIDGALRQTALGSPYLYSWNTSLESAGTHTVSAKAFDTSFNTAQTTITVNVVIPDATAPTLGITAPAANATITGTVGIAGTAADNAALSKVEVRVDTGAYSLASGLANWTYVLDTLTLSNGLHSVTVRATDSSNNVKTASLSLNVNNPVAVPAITSVAGTFTNGSAVTITGSAFGTKAAASPLVWDNLDSGAFNPAWRQTDGLGVQNGALNRHPYSTYYATHGFIANDPKYAYVRPGNAVYPNWYCSFQVYISSDFNFGTTGFDGTDKFLANIKIFRLWNPGSTLENVYVQYQGIGNQLLLIPENIPGERIRYFSGGFSQKIVGWHRMEFEYAENSSLGADDGKFRAYIDGQLVYSTGTLITRATANNTTDGVNNKRPYIIGFENEWSPGENGGGGVDPTDDAPNTYAMDEIYLDNTWSRIEIATGPTYITAGRREIQVPTSWSNTHVTFNLSPGSFNSGDQVYVYVVDSNGNANPNGYPITLSGAPADATLPTLSITAPANGATVSGLVTISGTSADNVGMSKVEVRIDTGVFILAGGIANWTYNLDTTALPNGAHTVTARATDLAGNVQTASISLTVANDITAPVISALTATGIGQSSATVSWSTNENADTQVEYGLTTAYGSSTSLNVSLGTSHAQLISGLTANTLYHYRARSKDASGNLAVSADATFTTLSTPLLPPPGPSGLTAAAVSQSRIDLSWTDNSTTETGFKIERKTGIAGTFAQIATVAANVTSYSNTGLAAGTTYFYQVRATNSAGDSSYSNQAGTITLNAPDTTLPTLGIVSPSNGATLSSVVTITGTAADNVGLSKVEISIDSGTYNLASGLSNWTYNLNTLLLSNGIHTITARATDSSNNVRSVTISVSVSNAAADVTAPTLAILSPAAGATVSGLISINGTAADNASLSKVEVSIDSGSYILASGAASWIYSLDTTALSNGTHTILARATDASGNSRTASITVKVSNTVVTPPPPVSTAPVTTISLVYDYQDGAQITILIKSNDSKITQGAMNSIVVNLPSGNMNLPLTKVDAETYYAKLGSATLVANSFDTATNPYITLTLPGGATVVSKVEKNIVIPQLGGYVKEDASQSSNGNYAQVVIKPGEITDDAKLTIHPEPYWDKAQREDALKRKNLKSMGEGREINFESSGTLQSAQLILPFDRTLMPAGMSFNRLKIAYFNPRTGEWEILESAQVVGDTLQVQVTHFSLYAPVLQLPSVDAGEAQAFAYPNPVRNGENPKLKAFVGQAQSVDFTVFNLASQKVYEETLQGDPTGIENGEYYYEKEWSDAKASGVYFLVVRAHKADGSILRLKSKFAVVR